MREEFGQPSMEPITKFDGSFMSIQRPSKLTFLWKAEIMSYQYASVAGLVKSGKATEPGHTWNQNMGMGA